MGAPATTAGRAEPCETESHVDKVLKETPHLPPITWSNWYQEVRWFNASVIFCTPLVGLYGALTTTLLWPTFLFGIGLFAFGMLGAWCCYGSRSVLTRVFLGITAGEGYPIYASFV